MSAERQQVQSELRNSPMAVAVRQLQAYVRWGTGAPNGVVVGSPGMLWLRTDGGAGTTLYVKESGVGTSSGWTAK